MKQSQEAYRRAIALLGSIKRSSLPESNPLTGLAEDDARWLCEFFEQQNSATTKT